MTAQQPNRHGVAGEYRKDAVTAELPEFMAHRSLEIHSGRYTLLLPRVVVCAMCVLPSSQKSPL